MHRALFRRRVSSPRNDLLAALSIEDYLRLLPKLEYVELRQNEILYESGGPIPYAFFPEQSVISLVTTLADGRTVEIAVVGNAGLLGISLALGGKTSFHTARVDIPGGAFRMAAEDFLTEFHRPGIFQKVMLNYIRCRIFMISQYVACNRLHPLRSRFARLLLMIYDNVGSSEFPMTQELMSQALGSSRPEVATVASLFRHAGWIAYHRGRVWILDAKGLQSAACECYSAIQQECMGIVAKNIA